MKWKRYISLLLAATIGLMAVALYNGFGLTEGDTGAYIEAGIRNMIPKDRSPFYGWFVRYTSMWTSLWFSLFAQCLLLAWLVMQYIKKLSIKSNAPPAARYMLITIIAILAFTCVSWVSGYLMPDVFAGILLLASLLFLYNEEGQMPRQIAYACIIFSAIIIHNSHFLIVALFSIALIVWALWNKNIPLIKRSSALLTLSAAGWLLICMVHVWNGYGFTFSRGRHVFMVTKFAETGILKRYLDENCGKRNLKLCNYKDQIPAVSWEFLWSQESPLYKTGGWDSSKAEYDIIIHDVLTTPRYLRMYLASAVTGTARQLVQVQAPDHTTHQGIWTSPWQRIGTYFQDELNEYDSARQNTGGISATPYNYLYYLFFILSALWLLIHSHILSKEMRMIYGSILLFLVVNALVTSIGSTVIYRFQNRVFWVLPATNAIIIISYYWYKYGQHARPDPEN